MKPSLNHFSFTYSLYIQLHYIHLTTNHHIISKNSKFVSGRQIQLIASGCLVVGAALGVAGTFVPSASLRGLAWGVDGVALVVAGALLTIHFVRIGHDLAAAGFLVFVAGETLVVSR